MLKCSKCKISYTVVVDSRDYGDYIRRRRKCQNCGYKQTTYERIESKQEPIKEIQEYRKAYPKDRRSDEKILKSLKEVEKMCFIELVHGMVWQIRRKYA